MRYLFVFFLLIFSFAQSQQPWAQDSIQHLYDLGILTGYPDGSFRGDDAASRYEVAVMLSRTVDSIEATYLTELAEIVFEIEAKVELLIANSASQDSNLAEMLVQQDASYEQKLELYFQTVQAQLQERNQTSISNHTQVIEQYFDGEATVQANYAQVGALTALELLEQQGSELDGLAVIVSALRDDLYALDNALRTLEGETASLEANMPQAETFIALIDERSRNLESVVNNLAALISDSQVRFEEAMTSNDLLVIETIRAQLADEVLALEQQHSYLREDMRAEFTEYVEQRLAIFSEELALAIAQVEEGLSQQIETQAEEVKRISELVDVLQARLDAPPTYTWLARLDATAGFRGTAPYYEGAMYLRHQETYLRGSVNSDGAHLLGEYNITDTLAIGARYRTNFQNSVGGVFIDNRFSEALGVNAELAYGNGVEFAVSTYHLGTSDQAIIPDLTMAVHFRISFGDMTRTLIDTQAQWQLDLGEFTLTPGIIFRNVTGQGVAYRGIIPSLSISGQIASFPLYGHVRYGFLTGLNDATYGRTAPEFLIGTRYNNLTVEGFMDSGLLDYERFADLLDNPTERTGYRLGLRARVHLDLTGDREY